MDESSQQAEDQNMEEAGQQAENQNMEEAGQQAENQNVEEAGQQAENQNVEEAGQQAEDQNVEEAGDDTSDNAGQAGERREDNSNQDWENSNQDWGRKKRDSSDLTYVDPRDEDMFILELDKQKALKIIGARGGMVREITKQSKAFIKIDPDAEPAKIRISGSFTAVDRARAMVHDILNSEYDKPRPEWTDNWEDQMFRKCTKEESSRIIGPRGSNIQYIEKKSWAKVEVGDEEDGFIMVRVSGDFDAVDTALTMMSDAINNTGDWSKGSNDWGSDGDRGRKRKRFQDGEEPEATEKLVFEASYSGSIVGRGGKEINRLRSESGAEIDIQKIDNDENCEVTIRGSADEVAEAVKLVNAFVEETRQKRNRPGAVTETLQFQKRAAKEIIGRKGANIREVRETSGADIKIGDDWDKCLVTITGIPEQLSIAWTKIKELAGEEGWNPDGDEGQKNDVPYHSRNDKNWNNKDWNNKDWNNKWENKSDNKEMADACAGCGNKFTDMSAMFCVRCGSKRLSKADAQSQMNSQMGQMLEKQQRYQLIRQAQAKPPQPPPSGQLVPFVDGKSDGSAQNSGDWNANVAGANGNSMDLGSTASVIGLASAKSPPLSKAPLPTGRPPPSAIMKAPGGLPNKVPPKFGGLDALCDNIQSGPDFDSFEEPPSSEVMGAALMKAPAKGNVVPAKLGGILSKGKGKGGKFQPMQIPGKPDNSESWENPKGKGKGGKFQPMQSFGKPDNSNSWDNSQDWQSGDDSNNDSWQQTPAVSKGMSKGPVQVPPRPAGPNFAFTQPAADDWDAGGADDWQSGNAWEFNSGQDNAFSQPGAEDDWSSAPSQQQQQQPWGAKPQQLSLHPQPDATDDWGPSPAMQQLQQLQQQQTPKFSWLQEKEQPAVQQQPVDAGLDWNTPQPVPVQKPQFSWLQGGEQPPAQQPPSTAQTPQFSWLQEPEQQASTAQELIHSVQEFVGGGADALPSDGAPSDAWGGWGF